MAERVVAKILMILVVMTEAVGVIVAVVVLTTVTA